jgi:hypothetical protein
MQRHFDSRHVIKVRERAIHPQLLVLRRMRMGPPPRRYDPESKLSRAATPDGEAADYCQSFISSSHCKMVFTACLRAHFDVMPRKLIPKLQAFSQCI